MLQRTLVALLTTVYKCLVWRSSEPVRPKYYTAEAQGTKVSWISRESERPDSVFMSSDLGMC